MSDNLPALLGQGAKVSPALMIMLDDKLFDRARIIAGYLAKAEGFTPVHLINKTEACFAVVTRAITWKLDPFAVAQATYSPSPGKVGFEGKLCQAIIENSGQVEGGVTYEPYGEWSKVQGKFKLNTNDKGKKYAVATYTDEDEAGLGVIARAQVKGEKAPRTYKIDLRQAHPRNSTLWATDPLGQLEYRAARGLGNKAMPGIFMGVPIGDDAFDYEPTIKDVTPSTTAQTASINDALMKAAQNVPQPEPTIEQSSTVPLPATPLEIPQIKVPRKDDGMEADWDGFVNEFIMAAYSVSDIASIQKLRKNHESPIGNLFKANKELHSRLVNTIAEREKDITA